MYIYPHTKNELSRSELSNVGTVQTDRQTNATENITTSHLWEVNIKFIYNTFYIH